MTDPEQYRITLENLNYLSVVVNYLLSTVAGYLFFKFFCDKKRTAVLGSLCYNLICIIWSITPLDGLILRYIFIFGSIFATFS